MMANTVGGRGRCCPTCTWFQQCDHDGLFQPGSCPAPCGAPLLVPGVLQPLEIITPQPQQQLAVQIPPDLQHLLQPERRYALERPLGEGAAGRVFRALCCSNRPEVQWNPVAMKVFKA
eukprot:tig00020941_g16220.t1